MDWTPTVPPYESQYSASTHIDAQNCVEESLCHIIYCLTEFRGSPRALAKQVGVDPTAGSSSFAALSMVNQMGLIPYSQWPTPASFDWDSYYAAFSQEVQSTAVPAKISLIPFDLTKSPGWTRLVFPNGEAHFVCQVNETQYFDSEQGNPIKDLTYNGAKVTSQMGISITGSFFPRSINYPNGIGMFSAQAQAAILENDKGGHNIIVNGVVVPNG